MTTPIAQGPVDVNVRGWIPVSESLPEKDMWVQVYEDDNDNQHDAFIGGLTKTFRQRVTPAKLLSIDSEGYADWYLCFVGGGPAKHVRNVTHWQPMAEAPNAQVTGASPAFMVKRPVD